MRIAVTYENGEIFQHFGHTAEFKIYEVKENKIIRTDVIGTGTSGHGALSGMLSAIGVSVLICGGIGAGAQIALGKAGIKIYGGVRGNADKAVEAFIGGNLEYDPEAKCDHHGHGDDHDCGEHGCGEDSCH
ncbi:MAG: dinitrogenase iron-molybdenum cofactor biosynthesis protein [Clostridia bacterium]|nr:dinitrogenase iron-molybdenum cofactor biosynthesis protein [Clostridia bacterium]